MPIHLDPQIKRTDEALVAEVHSLPTNGSVGSTGNIGSYSVTFRSSTRLESFANSLRDFFSFGLYSRLLGNPSQWKKLRNSLLQDAQHSQTQISEVALKRLFLTYSDSSKLTAAKLNNILSDYERAKNDPNWQPQLNPKSTYAAQSYAARLGRSIQELARKLTPQEKELKDLAAAKAEEYAQAKQEFESLLEAPTRGKVTQRYRGNRDWAERPAIIGELANGVYAAKAMQHILRPGRSLQADDLSYYMAALQREAKSANQFVPDDPAQQSHYQFGYKLTNWPTQPVGEVFEEARNGYFEHMRSIGHDAGLYAIPLVLDGKGSLENHVVLIAIDADRQQINLLDSKGYSLEALENSYGNTAGLKEGLENLGKSIFGQGWNARRNILQMNIPKQLGANDCGAFVCDFARQLLNGKSIGDIERTFDAKQRSELRLRAAQTIKEGFLDNLDEDLQFLRAAEQKNAEMQSLVERYEPTFEALQKPDPVSPARPANSPAIKVVTTDGEAINPDLYSPDPPFGTGGIVKGHYVQRQFGECCLSHALASYFQKPIFNSREEFLDYRNTSYDNYYHQVDFPEEIIAENKSIELSEVEPVLDVLNRLQSDPTRNLALSTAPWTSAIFRATDPGPGIKLDSQGMKQKIDVNFAYLANASDSKRFIVRSGDRSGHFQTLVYEPEKNPLEPWTLLNSTSNLNEGSLLPQVKSGSSPAELLGAHTDRGLVLGIWTQSNHPSANIGWQDLMDYTPPAAA